MFRESVDCDPPRLNYFNYYTEIEDTFVRRRGKHLFLSPIDWAMIEGWQERGIPLHIVIRGIETVFDGFEKKPRPRSIKGLLYCREEIEAQFQEWLESQTGKADGVDVLSENTIEEISNGINAAIEALRQCDIDALREDIERVIDRLSELQDHLSPDLQSVDGSLLDIEKILDQTLLTKTDKAHLTKVEKDIIAELKPYKKGMDAAAYSSTFQLMLLKRLREDAGIPRLSLFYLL